MEPQSNPRHTALPARLLEDIVRLASDAIIAVDESQRIILFNHGAEDIFGYPAEEALGQPLSLLLPPPARTRHVGQMERFGAGPESARRMGHRGEIAGRRKSGEVFPAEASISKHEVDGRRIYTSILRDISDRKRAEAARAEQARALAEQAAELARSNAELEQFAYVASHDLQEPLRMVASYTELLERRYAEKLDEDAREFIGFAVEGVHRMRALIHDLLAYSRVGTRGRELVPTDLDGVLERVLRTLGPAIEESGAVVTHDPLPTLPADAVQMDQLLQNLLGNALKFHRPGEPPRVHVGARREGAGWVISVRDRGIGIDPAFHERVFVIFQRLHTRGEYPGTGIGLAICRKIVERHGGRIRVESAPGEGTTFHVHLPGDSAAGADADGPAALAS